MDLSQVSDHNIMEEIKAGNELAFTEMFTRYEKLLKVVAFDKLRDLELAEEVIHDVLLSIWQRRIEINIKTSLKSYLDNAVRKQCAYKLRSLAKYKKMESPVDLSRIDFGFYPAYAMDNKELARRISFAIEHISAPSNRKAFEMHYIEHIPQKKIAKIMNVTEGAIKQKIYRAVKEMRLFLDKYL